MEYDRFIDVICEKLQELSPERKDAWILEQAKLVSESAQQDFLMSLTGEKKIAYMPTEAEIEEFCRKVQSGEIYVEYETHYYEFDSDGRYIDDWKVWHNDPTGAFPFLDRTFRGCRDLLRLGEYGLAREILDKVCRLKFQVVDAEESEDIGDDSPFTVADAEKERKLSMRIFEIGHDWVEALLLDHAEENREFAGKLLEVLDNEICQQLNLSDFAGLLSEKLLDYIEELLGKKIEKIDADLKEFSEEGRAWWEKYALEKKKARSQQLLLDTCKKC